LHQLVMGSKTPFARTPKVENRTAIPRLYIAAPMAFAVSAVASAWWRYQDGFGLDTAFALMTAALVVYALAVFVGPRAAFDDLVRHPEPARSTTDEHVPAFIDQAA
jgi:cellulose synthase (UDP-forming)